MFKERAFLVLQYVTDEETKKTKYQDMTVDDIWEFVSISNYRTLEDIIAKAQE